MILQLKRIQIQGKYNVTSRETILVITLCLLVGCYNDDSTNLNKTTVDPTTMVFECKGLSEDSIEGCWQEELCRRSTNYPGDMTHEKITYSYQSGFIFQRLEQWNNSECIGEVTGQTDSNYLLADTYKPLSENLLTDEGLEASILEIGGLKETSLIFYTAYHIENGRLCMTPNTLGEHGVYQHKNIIDLPLKINYELCFIRGEY